MRVLWMTWKDIRHPAKGGAEVVTHAIATRLVRDGHTVTLLTSSHPGALDKEEIEGYTVIRVGGRFSVYWKAFRYYREHLRGQFDLVVDEMNTMPFFAKFFVKEKNVMFVHQLCREIWFHQMAFPFSYVGYILEPVYLRLLSDSRVITVSESTKLDLMRHGFAEGNISIVSEGIELAPVADLESIKKAEEPTLLSLGSVRPMKRTMDILKAFELVKTTIPNAKLIIAGDMEGTYGDSVACAATQSPYAKDITQKGRVSMEEKTALMRSSHVLLVTSLKEGWGLVVTEANSQGTPAVVYDVDGLRDSVKDGVTGVIAHSNTPQGLAEGVSALLSDKDRYASLRASAHEWSKSITFDKQYQDFKNALNI